MKHNIKLPSCLLSAAILVCSAAPAFAAAAPDTQNSKVVINNSVDGHSVITYVENADTVVDLFQVNNGNVKPQSTECPQGTSDKKNTESETPAVATPTEDPAAAVPKETEAPTEAATEAPKTDESATEAPADKIIEETATAVPEAAEATDVPETATEAPEETESNSSENNNPNGIKTIKIITNDGKEITIVISADNISTDNLASVKIISLANSITDSAIDNSLKIVNHQNEMITNIINESINNIHSES